MSERRLDIVIRARNLAAQGFKQAAAQAKKFSANMAGINDGAANALAKMAMVGAAAQASFGAASMAVSAFKGDWEKFESAFESLPIIGQVRKLRNEFMDLATGVTESLEKIEAAKAKIVERGNASKAKLNTEKTARANIAQIGKQLDNAARVAAGGERERIKLQAEQQADAIRKEFQKLLTPSGSLSGADAKKMFEQFDKIDAAMRQKLAELDKKNGDRQADEAKKQADRIAQLDGDIRAKQLEAEGKHQEAMLAQIREGYRRRIAAATTEAEKARLKTLMGLDVASASQKASASSSPTASINNAPGLSLTTRYQGLIETQNLDKARNSKLDKVIAETKQQTKQLADLTNVVINRPAGIVF